MMTNAEQSLLDFILRDLIVPWHNQEGAAKLRELQLAVASERQIPSQLTAAKEAAFAAWDAERKWSIARDAVHPMLMNGVDGLAARWYTEWSSRLSESDALAQGLR